jgi:uroporphyrinogen decarboxylase
VDRIPYGVGIGWYPWGETVGRWLKESGREKLDVVKEFGFDASCACPSLHSGIFPGFEQVTIRDEGDMLVYRDSRGITIRGRKDGGSIPQFLDYPVKIRADWDQLKAERLDPAAPGRVTQDWNAFRERLRESGEAVQVGGFPYGVFGAPRDLMGVEALLIAFYEDPEMLKDMMAHLTTIWLTLWARVANEVQIDHIHIWEDMSGRQGSLISPRMVEEFMMPQYDRIVCFAREAGVRVVSVDTDGDCSELVPVMMNHGVNMFFPFEVQAGNEIRDYRRRYPELGIMGGLDKRALAGRREDVDREVERAAAMVRQGRYIPGFDHLIPPDASWDNYRYAAERLKDVCYGRYSGASSQNSE